MLIDLDQLIQAARKISFLRFVADQSRNMAGVMMAQRQMAFVHPFSFEFKRLAYEAVKQERRQVRASAQ